MKDISHEILSHVHHLLSIASEDDLNRVGRLPTLSPHLRAALNSLAEEKAATGISNKSSKASSSRNSSRRQFDNASGATREMAGSLQRLNKNQIQEVLKSIGVSLSMNSKDSKGRIIRRAMNVLRNLTEEERHRFAIAVQTQSDNQTEGWVSVVRKG
jgi:ABC-type protease/lipase transport system fused ATPase/permease subunit